MNPAWTAIEEIARTSDDSAVRQRFNARNRGWLIGLLMFFGIFSFIHAGHSKSVAQVANVALHFLTVASILFAITARSFRDRARRHISAIAIGFIAVQYTLVLLFSPAWHGWAIAIPWMMLVFRMSATELVLLHALLASGGVLMRFVSPPSRGPANLVAIIVAVNVASLAINLFLSSRRRKRIIAEIGERREHAREQIRMRDELHYAREVQLSMLPERAPDLPWADIAGASVPATEVGGDYYDYFVVGERLALVCGDVAGHGMAAGLVLSSLRSGFRLLRDSLHDPAAVLRRLHELLVETSRRRMLVTASVIVIDPAEMRARIASAGYPPVLLRRADGSVESIALFTTPLGVRLPIEIPERTIDIESGDTFVLHSDGVYETRNGAGEFYGLERLEELVRRRGGEPAVELRDAIFSEIAAFRGAADVEDDVTVVVCRVR